MLPESTTITGRFRGLLPYFLLIAAAFAVDRLSKIWAADFYAQNGATQLHPLLTITQTFNRGIALGMFQGIGSLVGWLSIGVLVVMFIFLVRTSPEQWLIRAGLAVAIGGALGNLVDRIIYGEVLDFVMTPLRSGVFNMADVMIYVGMGLVLVGAWRGSRQKVEPDEVGDV